MASMKAERPVGSQLFGAKKEPAKAAEGTSKSPAAKGGAKKAALKPLEPKKKGKGGKAAAKH